MKRTFFLLLTVIVFNFANISAAEEYFLPKTIQFKGAPEYSNQELIAAAGLKKGTYIGYSAVKGYAQKLLDTGLFESSAFTFNGADLVFNMVASPALYSVRMDNLPLVQGKKLESALRERVPLYRGKVPYEGGLTEDVRKALEEMLAARGIKATVAAMPNTGGGLQGVNAMSFVVTDPPVQVGEIRLDGASAPLDSKASEILAKLTGTAFGQEGSSNQIETNLGDYYREKGYLEAAIRATAQIAPVVTPKAIRVPFVVSVSPGSLYKLAGVQLAPELLVKQVEFDRQSRIHTGDIAAGTNIRENWQFIERQYHNQGYMKAVVHPAASFDRAQGTVSFAVTVEPGPVYTMGKLTIENSADDLRTAMLAAWKMPAGTVFNEGAIRDYFTMQGMNTPLGRTFATATGRYAMHLNDDTHTVDLALHLEKKH